MQLVRRLRAQLDHLARGLAGIGPFSPEMHYDVYAGDDELTDPVPNRTDAALRDVARRFAAVLPVRRAKLTAAVTESDFYALMQFAKRCAVFALRERRPERIAEGLAATAMLDPHRVDPRDIDSPLGLLAYAARAIGADADRLFAAAARLARPGMRDVIMRVARSPYRDLGDWMYALIQMPAGPGFVALRIDPYDATLPLDHMALALAELIGADVYGRGRVEIGTRLPAYWLRGVDDVALDRALHAVRAAATVYCNMRPSTAPDGRNDARIIVAFLAELGDESSAEALHRIAAAETERSNDVALLGVREARVFCLLVARSCVQGVPPIETSRSLRRFEPGISAVLARYGAQPPILRQAQDDIRQAQDDIRQAQDDNRPAQDDGLR